MFTSICIYISIDIYVVRDNKKQHGCVFVQTNGCTHQKHLHCSPASTGLYRPSGGGVGFDYKKE